MNSKYINIENQTNEELLELFKTLKQKTDIYKHYKLSGNSSDIDYINKIAQKIGFDFSYYKENKKRFCLNCGKELKNNQKKFCCSSCSASYNNKGRKLSEETRKKISKSLSKHEKQIQNNNKVKNENVCANCGVVIKGNKKFCSNKCHQEWKHKELYKSFLENPEEFCRGNYTPKSFKKEFLEEQNGVCAICGCKPEHNGKPLVFIIDHIDGDASNNHRDNLRMICPNCDSQLPTFKSKNKNSTRRNYWKEKLLKSMKP